MDELAFSEGDGSWAVSAEIEGMLGLATLGTGIEAPAGEDTTSSRKCRIDRENVGSATAFADHLRVVWLTPAMDPLFNGPAAERRRFLDRLVLAVDAQHSARVNALERSLRSRNRLLEDPRSDPHWLDAIERETAEVAVAVAAARAETVGRLAGALHAARDQSPAFAMPEIALDGWMEKMLPSHSALEIEDRYRDLLKQNRAQDAAAGRTLDGPHRSDLKVTHAAKGIPAADCSTGEQKALLIRLVLAHSSLIKDMTGYAPLMLLDEVVAHLDPMRRGTLYDALTALGAQVWMTGADPAAFGDIVTRAQVFEVRGGAVDLRH
jgi:DNA replication and repair protein RecF